MMWRSGLWLGLILAGNLAIVGESLGAAAGLQLNPLKYEDTLIGSNARNGFIDVSNPGDTELTVTTSVKGFRQADLDGNLEYFDDPVLKRGIIMGLPSFNLGPREAIRTTFTVDPKVIPKGGVYVAIFFQTVPPDQPSGASYITESASVGTLPLLQNGGSGEHIGAITKFELPLWQLGNGLRGRLEYQNTNRTTEPIAFAPQLASHVTPWGRAAKFIGPYVLPGSVRQLDFNRPGSFFGFIPVQLSDTASGQSLTTWVLACTGWYSTVLLVVLVMGLCLLLFFRRPLWRKLFRRRRPVRLQRPIDGLAPRK